MTARFNGDVDVHGKVKLRKLDRERFDVYHFGKPGPVFFEVKREKRNRSNPQNGYIHWAFEFIAHHKDLTLDIVKKKAKLALLRVPVHEVVRRLMEFYKGDEPEKHERELYDLDLPPVCHPTSSLSVEAMNLFIEQLPAWSRETFDVGLPLPDEVNIYESN